MSQRAPVGLELAEIAICAEVAKMRMLVSIKDGHRQRNGIEDTAPQFDYDITGALGECALAKHLNVYWNFSIRNYTSNDVAGLQVKSTPHQNGHLLVKKNDPGDQRYVLAIVQDRGRRVIIRGWIDGVDAKLNQYWGDFNGNKRFVYKVPQHALRDIDEVMRSRGLKVVG